MSGNIGRKMQNAASFRLAISFAKAYPLALDANDMMRKSKACASMSMLCKAILTFYGEEFEKEEGVKEKEVSLKKNIAVLEMTIKMK